MGDEHTEKTWRRLSFSTEALPVDGRIELWENHNSEALLPLDIRTLDDAPMTAAQANLVLPSMRVASVKGTSQIVERSEAFIRDNPTGVVAIFFALEGEAFFVHSDGMLSLRPGQAVVYHGDRPFTRGFPTGLRELVLTIPESSFVELFGNLVDKLPFVFSFGRDASPSTQSLTALLAEAIGSAGEHPRRPLAEAGALQDRLLELTHHALTGSTAGAKTLVALGKDLIGLRYNDPKLSVEEIAAGVGISARQLSRAFAEAGLTVAGYLRWRRISVAQMMLRDPHRAGLSIAEIGARCGFSSASSFARAFRAQVGCTPRNWRKMGGS
ncbi:AraC family transcriptional regulator [Corynebacterium yudongzhengii]|uniref:AraC family transcriptional regulator n=1 Tax=Corynebacterium yudongzhengii TaxID=2080740 RepID=A0A2U1T4H9_9CORY|nr:AraC family transcriptional regulator [Corynebacterium yudongzhengii]AWB82888.1 AraC family transcriptional regulator [Corynebacterium yudongzhengii]PWC00916.1 AraC family transcriptional regulator [Corynebacterium yudongzhengii]